MALLHLFLIVAAIIVFLFAAVGVQAPRGGNLIALGLALWALSTIVTV